MKTRRERGSSLIFAIFMTGLLLTLAIAASQLSLAKHGLMSAMVGTEKAFLVAEAALDKAIVEINQNEDGCIGTGNWKEVEGHDQNHDGYPTAGEPHVNLEYLNGDAELRYFVWSTDLGDGAYDILAYAEVDYEGRTYVRYLKGGGQREKTIHTEEGYTTVKGAITSAAPVWTTGSICIDGRDWDTTGSVVVGPGMPGINSCGEVVRQGDSTIGGSGLPPEKVEGEGRVEEGYDWADGIDDDEDGQIDEETFDGVDNDGDGEIDEDVNGFPMNPDVALGLAVGTLKASAQKTGTYFTSGDEVNQYITDNGGNFPGGVLVYLEFDAWIEVYFGDALNEQPSVIVMHNDTGTALMKNLNGQFKGLVMSDLIEHVNGDAIILGGVHSFADEDLDTQYGNGNAYIKFSSGVLADLPWDQMNAVEEFHDTTVVTWEDFTFGGQG